MATLYVDSATGNDTRTYTQAQSPLTPWATIYRAARGAAPPGADVAAQAAHAGDTVIIAAGTYSAPGLNSRFAVALNPANNGLVGSPITFQANGTVTLTLSSGSGPVIGAFQRNYIVWDGFTINETNAPPAADTGPVVFNQCTGCSILNATLSGTAVTYSDNHNGVRIEAANGTRVYNCIIHGFGDNDGGGAYYGQNSAGVMLYDSNDTIIENNTIYREGSGIFIKGQHPGQTQRRTITRKNLIYDCDFVGLNLLADYQGQHYQNIIRDCSSVAVPAGIKMFAFGSGEGAEPVQSWIVNNTIDGVPNGILLPAGGSASVNYFYNNLITNQTNGGLGSLGLPASSGYPYTFDRNLYNGNAQVAKFNQDGSVLNLTFVQWQGYGEDANGSTANPLYVNAGTNDFHLQGASPALTLGRVVNSIGGTNGATIPAGAYITGSETIGAGATPPTPVPPTFTSASSTSFTAGSFGTFQVQASPGVTSIARTTGTLPSGVTYTDNLAGTGTLAGTPALGTQGLYSQTFIAVNSDGSTPQSFALTVNPAASSLYVPVAAANLETQGIL